MIHLEKVGYSKEYLALKFKKYDMTLRDYVRHCRKPEELNKIFLAVINGMKELQVLGYTHRDLKPDNVVLNIDPLEVRIIDFDTARLCQDN